MIEIFFILTGIKYNMSFKLMLKQSFSIRSSSSIKAIKQKLEILPRKKFPDDIKIKLFLHQSNIMSNIFNNLNCENRFIYSFNISKSVCSDLVEFDNFGEFEVCCSVFSYGFGLGED